MRLAVTGLACGLLLSLAGAASAQPSVELERRELAEAKALFEQNVQAIIDRNREAYLACYLPSARLVRTGPDGFSTGYAQMAEGTPATGSEDWPESLTASDLKVTWLRAGLVYGTYRYVVVISEEETTGLSERLMMKTEDGWRVIVSTAFPAVAADAAPETDQQQGDD